MELNFELLANISIQHIELVQSMASFDFLTGTGSPFESGSVDEHIHDQATRSLAGGHELEVGLCLA